MQTMSIGEVHLPTMTRTNSKKEVGSSGTTSCWRKSSTSPSSPSTCFGAATALTSSSPPSKAMSQGRNPACTNHAFSRTHCNGRSSPSMMTSAAEAGVQQPNGRGQHQASSSVSNSGPQCLSLAAQRPRPSAKPSDDLINGTKPCLRVFIRTSCSHFGYSASASATW